MVTERYLLGRLEGLRAGARSLLDVYRWIYREFMRQERWRLALNVVALAVASGTLAALALLISPAIDRLLEETDSAAVYGIPLGVMVLVMVNGAALFASALLTETIVQNTTLRLQCDVYQRFLGMGLESAAQHPTGVKIAFVTNEVGRAITGLTTLLIGLTKESITFVALLGVMLWRDWQLSLFVLVSFPPLVLAVSHASRAVRKATLEAMDAGFHLTRLSTDVLNSLRLVKIFDAAGFEAARHRRCAERRRDKSIELMRRKATLAPINEIAGGIAISAALTFAIARGQAEGAFQIGEIASFLTAVMLAYRPLKKITSSVPSFVEGMVAAERIRGLHALGMESREGDQADDGEPVSGRIEIDGVGFSYGDGPPVLRQVSLSVPAGSTVALVGPSGSGKTTLINLLPRLYATKQGQIRIGGHDVARLPLAKLRRSIALVSQETVLLDDTVMMNVAYGADRIDRERAERCLRDVNLWRVIEQLPLGLDNPVGEGGATLSGGQRQRLALARALYRDAPILLLDEPTSALDGESEREVRETIRGLSKGRSILIVAHRLPVIEFADYVYVLVDGQIVEEGTHETLRRTAGVYATIFGIQALEDRFGRQLTA